LRALDALRALGAALSSYSYHTPMLYNLFELIVIRHSFIVLFHHILWEISWHP